MYFPLVIYLTVLFEKHVLTEETTTEKMTLKNGYPFEKYWVKTKDDYWLRLHRIPYGKHETADEAKGKTKEVFFLQHGLTASSSNFVWNSKGMAFTLADAGYDVWMGNCRGNPYSYAHAHLKNTSKEYWDFSFDEMAEYDLPAMIDHTLELTNKTSVWYAAHSQGTMIMFAKLSDDPDFGFKIKGFFAMAPVAKLDTVYEPIRRGCSYFYGLKWMWDGIPNLHSLPLPYDMLKVVLKTLCELDFKQFCVTVYAAELRHRRNSAELRQRGNSAELRHRRNSVDLRDSGNSVKLRQRGNSVELRQRGNAYWDWIQHIPESLRVLFTDGFASIKNLYHYCQAMDTGLFQRYDYGWFGNLLFYHQLAPPKYDVSNIRTDVWLYSGSNDILSSHEDVVWLQEQIGDAYVKASIVLAGYDHVTFLKNPKAKKDIYDGILKIVQEKSNSERNLKRLNRVH